MVKKANTWGTTITDYLLNKYGIPMFSKINLNEQLSKRVTDVFEDTKVKVYIFNSKKAIVMSVPGADETVTPTTLRIQKTIDVAYQYYSNDYNITNLYYTPSGNPVPLFSFFEIISNAILNNSKPGGETKLEYIPSSNKLSTNIPNVTVFVSTKLVELLGNDEELIAVIIHEVGKNTSVFKQLIISLISSITFLLYFTVIGAHMIYKGVNHPDNERTPWDRLKGVNQDVVDEYNAGIYQNFIMYLVGFGILVLIAYIVSLYFGRRYNIDADEFVIKCGYGEPLNNAIRKYNKFIFASSISKEDAFNGMNMFDRILHWFRKIGAIIYNFFSKLKLTPHQSVGERDRTISTKTDNYDISKNNIDRSERISESLNQIIRDVKMLNGEYIINNYR